MATSVVAAAAAAAAAAAEPSPAAALTAAGAAAAAPAEVALLVVAVPVAVVHAGAPASDAAPAAAASARAPVAAALPAAAAASLVLVSPPSLFVSVSVPPACAETRYDKAIYDHDVHQRHRLLYVFRRRETKGACICQVHVKRTHEHTDPNHAMKENDDAYTCMKVASIMKNDIMIMATL
eukprot:COSAG02_NODE_8886_length_2409_cov_1.267532_3_plen_180_part_00